MGMNKFKILFPVLFAFCAVTGISTAFAVDSLPMPAIQNVSVQHLNSPSTIEEMRMAQLTAMVFAPPLKGLTLEMKSSAFSTVKITEGKNDEFNVAIDKDYPLNLNKPEIRIKNDFMYITIRNWNVLTHGEVAFSFRVTNSKGQESGWAQSNNVLAVVNYPDEFQLPTLLGVPGLKSMEDWITSLLSKTAGIRPSYPYTLSVTAEWSSGTDGIKTRMPVLLAPPKEYFNTDGKTIAEAIIAWERSYSPANAKLQYVFQLHIYKNSQQPLPLLMIQQIELPRDKVSDN